jgi:O-antigen/teichoic acid export membrane protein
MGAQAAIGVAGVLVVPFIVRGLGTEAFGAFQLVWAVLAYFAMMDLGLGRATTRFVADAIGRGEAMQIAEIVGTTAIVQALLGLGVGLLVAGLSPVLSFRWLSVPPHLRTDVTLAFGMAAVAIPVSMLTSSLSGAIEGHGRFGWVNAVRLPAGVATLVAPLIALRFGAGLLGVVASVVLVRIGALLAFGVLLLTLVPSSRGPIHLASKRLRMLASYGGWLTVSSILSPLMTYLDRFVIGHMVDLRAVAYYSAPSDAVARVGFVPGSVAAAVFPAAASLSAAGNRAALRVVFARAVASVAFLLLPAAVAGVVLARPLLGLWLGADFARYATRPTQVLLVGMFVNGLAQVPYAVLQAIGRPDLTAKFHMIEFPVYAVALGLGVTHLGLTGAALAWLLRATLDTTLLFGAAFRLQSVPVGLFGKEVARELSPARVARVISSWRATGRFQS